MIAPETLLLRSRAELRAVESAWDDLWFRSHVTSPMSRAALLDLWLERFGTNVPFCAVVVASEGRFLAALPLVAGRWARLVPVGGLTNNDWCCAGNFLLDATIPLDIVLPPLVSRLERLGWSFFRFPYVRVASPQWKSLTNSLTASGFQIESRPVYEVPFLPVDQDWEAYRASWTSSHRTSVSRYVRKLAAAGEMVVERLKPAVAEVGSLVHEVARVEDAGWKGEEGTSLLKTPGMLEFLKQQGERLASLGHLEIALLRLNGQSLAFEWLWNAKGVLHGYKTGYDESFAKLSPGIVLLHELLRDLFTSRRCDAYDFMGASNEMLRRWAPTTLPLHSLTIAPPRLLGRALMYAYRRWRPAAVATH